MRKGDDLTTFMCQCLVIWSLNRPEPSGPHRPVIGVVLPVRLSYCRCIFFFLGRASVVRNLRCNTADEADCVFTSGDVKVQL